MKFESRLTKPATVTKACVEYKRGDGANMLAEYADSITLDTDTPIEIWECECEKHPCVSFWSELSDGTPALVTGILQDGATAIRISQQP